MDPQYCWGAHDFLAENPDEVSFRAGERILIIERDDLYSDGWWQGTNERGESGLFPMSYTSLSPPSVAVPLPVQHTMQATMSEVQTALDQLGVNQSTHSLAHSHSESSLRSQTPAGDDDEYMQGRESLAAAAKNNLAKAVQLQREQQLAQEHEFALQRAQEEEQLRMHPPPIEGLQLSDESDDEEEPSYMREVQAPTSAASDTPTWSAVPLPETPQHEIQAIPEEHTATQDSESITQVYNSSPIDYAPRSAEIQPSSSSESDSPQHTETTPQPIHTEIMPAQTIDANAGTNDLMAKVVHAQTAPSSPIVTSSPNRSVNGNGRERTSMLSATQASPTSASSPRPSETESTKYASADPRQWTVDQVIEWGQAKGFDEVVLSKFMEHEISGDVLLEMDLNTLKEIDLPAFGRRVKIFNGIKELRRQVESGRDSLASTGARSFSPSAFSGYEPDTPSTTYLSPRDSLSSPPQSAGLPHLKPTKKSSDASSQPPSAGSSSLRGLGFQDRRNSSAKSSTVDLANGHSAEEETANASGAETGLGSESDRAGSTRRQRLMNRVKTSTGSVRKGVKSDTETEAPVIRQKATSVPSPAVSPMPKSKSSFIGALARGRKAPPTFAAGEQPASVNTLPLPAKEPRRGPRLFASFGSNNNLQQPQRHISSPIPAGTPIPSKTSATLTSETTTPAAPAIEKTASTKALDKIGTPEYAGWLRKKGEKYNTWKLRYLVLKGSYLYFMKSENEQAIKGFVDLAGYKFISDANVDRGRYGFKAIKQGGTTHYFSSENSVITRDWMKALMKATIGRDYSAPVVSSCNMETIPLAVAQTMNPPIRPPSPTSRARAQRAAYRGSNPNSLSQKDAAILMGLQSSSPPASPKQKATKRGVLGKGFLSGAESDTESHRSSKIFGNLKQRAVSNDEKSSKRLSSHGSANFALAPIETSHSVTSVYPTQTRDDDGTPTNAVNYPPTIAEQPMPTSPEDDALLEWFNTYVPAGTPQAYDWTSPALASGQIFVRSLEKHLATTSDISDEEFEAFHHPSVTGVPDLTYLDTMFKVFDYFADNQFDTREVSMNDLMGGNQQQIITLAQAVRDRIQS